MTDIPNKTVALTSKTVTDLEAWIASARGQLYSCTRQYPHPGYACDHMADCVGCLMVAAALELRKASAVETSEPSPTWVFVERVATYSDYTHDDVDELKILYDLQAAAALLYGDGSRPERTIQQTGWWQCPCCQNYYTPERIVCPVSGDSRPAVNGSEQR